MRVIVLGAGLLGVTSAYYLQQLGHEVTVIDRHAMPCAKARGHASAERGDAPTPLLLAPTRPSRIEGAVAALRRAVHQRASRLAVAFGAPRPHPIEHMARLGAYSRETVRALRADAGVAQTSRHTGLLKFFMDQRAFDNVLGRAPRLKALGCEAVPVSAEEALRIEPALSAMRAQLAGATYVADDPTLDPAQAASSMVFLCRAAGVRFLTRHTVVAIDRRDDRIEQVELTDPHGQPLTLRANAYVMALGIGSVPHARSLGIDLPLHTVREYLVTLPIKDASRAPRVGLQDQSGKLRIDRIQTDEGDCLRVSAMVAAGIDEEREPDSDRFNAILRRVSLVLPGVGDASRATFTTKLHAASASGLPLLGRTRLRNLFLNIAPEAQGWVNAGGAGKSIARIVSGLRPELSFAFTGM
ncbi:MAG: FAD-dependent oxidoreductase [Comamonadaceae bacterium]|nr:MAG: FAD-dependent oxidoreductase [Comamonadaceae bacterium]